MNQTECAFCGALNLPSVETCVACASLLPKSPSMPNSNVSHPQHPLFDQTINRPQASNRSFCPKCGISIPNHRPMCFKCSEMFENRSSFLRRPNKPLLFAIGSVILLLAGSWIYYLFAQPSPESHLKNYKSATGLNDSLIYENYVLKGRGRFTLDKMNEPDVKNELTFQYVYEKPGRSSLEYNGLNADIQPNDPSQFYLKRLTNGEFGEEYMYFFQQVWLNQEVAPNDHANGEFRLEFPAFYYPRKILNPECPVPKPIEDQKCPAQIYQVEGESITVKTSQTAVIEVNDNTGNAIPKTKTLFFDSGRGFLMKEIQLGRFNKSEVTSIITYNDYRKFKARRKNFFGSIVATDIYYPTNIKIFMTNHAGFEMTLFLNIDTLQFDQPIDEKVYRLPPDNEG